MKQRILFLLCFCVLLGGCGREPSAVAETETAPRQTQLQQTQPMISELEAVAEQPPEPPSGVVLQPEASGELEQRCEDAVIDYSHTSDGYIMACYTADTENRLKIQVKGTTATYTYNLQPGEWAVLPLSDGSGEYKASIYRNVGGNRYALVMSTAFSAQLQDEFAPFLRPNQYVNYLDAPASVEKGALLCDGLAHPLEKVDAVYRFVVETLEYDHEKASTVKSGYLPVLDEVLAEEKGICFDYAALMTAMLRSQEIPCKLVVGYAGSTYHAWISVWTEENGWVDGAIFFDGNVWKRMDPTFASSQHRSEEIMDFIEHGNYRVKYLY